ncbi:DUF547 domain-containing protein [Lentiprolixibacter aurantiacus]|uniref:DUF547 domain-containing protein n=1 Tax=Lentiprolixibacter aurantiacus TaxID=2993939 RepID=A0AAE3MIN9_9FLAO|nr:DUF547 domain-containing protein [Lentiprolixibacter aurantiacus]MCX2718138.1 DUF547 domain-containing protein [Lentiprolixibacter aurantiacus]
MNQKGIYFLLFCVFFNAFSPLSLTAQDTTEKSTTISHKLWGELLEKHVDEHGNVDYYSFRKNIDILDKYLQYLALNEPLDNWSRADSLAYYINLYNAATVKLILQHYAVGSIQEIKQPWGRKWIRVGEHELSLNQIEHKILRKMHEPRIHFAINCASASCPKLLNIPFAAQNIEEQLEQATHAFINDPQKNQINPDSIVLSALFKWYKNDFTENGSLLGYISRYTGISYPKNAKIKYLKYNWSLNAQ